MCTYSLTVAMSATAWCTAAVYVMKVFERPPFSDGKHRSKTVTEYRHWANQSLQACYSVCQGRICSEDFTCRHTEIEVADQSFRITQSQYTNTGPTSPSNYSITPGAWFPVGLLGLLASGGYPIPGEVNVVLVILVLPLNAALNPFLYTVNTLLERRQREREKQLLLHLTKNSAAIDTKNN